MDLERYDVNGAYEQLGIARDPLIACVSELATAGVTGRFNQQVKLTSGVPEIVDETIVHLSLSGVPDNLPHDRPLKLGHLMEAGALSLHLRSAVIYWGPSFKYRNVKDLGASTYSQLMRVPNPGIETLVRLMTIVEASRQTDEFTSKHNARVPHPEGDPVSRNWEQLSTIEQCRAVGRLLRLLGNPKFMDQVMPIVTQLEAASHGLGLASPVTVSARKFTQQ
jgi:hypothetical protein